MQTPDKIDSIGPGGEQGILEAAEHLFADRGFDAVSMSAIAQLANTSKANIYHHFKNKNELYLAIMKTAVERSSALLDAIEHASGSYSQRLSDFAAGQLDNILSHRRSMQLVLREALGGSSERGREIANYAMAKVFSRLAAMISQGQQQGEFRKELNPTLAAFLVVAANTFFFQSRPVMEYLPEVDFADNPGSFSQSIMDIFFNGTLQRGRSGQ